MSRQAIIATMSGRFVDLLNLRAEDVEINDVAHALSMICRWGGHVRDAYNVAQHSVLVSEIVEERYPQYALHGLLHDATEAYVGDVVGPLKAHLPEFRRIERGVWIAIAERFDLDPKIPREVHEADKIALATEWSQLAHKDARDKWSAGVAPLTRRLRPEAQLVSYYEFLGRFNALTSARRAA